MCISPVKLSDVGFVACRLCWQCREHKVDDWVGRNIAESKTAKAAHAVTLTYGRDKSTGGIDHLRAAVLTYSDVQKLLKRLRSGGYPCRYFVTGEYGSVKGRAHWHILMYWQGKVPDVKLRDDYFSWDFWPHGFSYWDDMSAQSVRYCCKYILKDPADTAAQAYGVMPSKKPPLGDAFFRELAGRYVDAGLAPQDLFYSFADVKRVHHAAKGKTAKALHDSAKPIQFHMRDKTADNFCRYFYEGWRERYNDEPPRSELIWTWLDKGLKAYVDAITLPQFNKPGWVSRPDKPPPGGSLPLFDEKRNCYWSNVEGVRLWWSHDTDGEIGWHEKIRPDHLRLAREAAEDADRQKGRYLSMSLGE